MSEARIEILFDEFATRYRRGERPDVREYLERAGPEREDLGRLIDRFLQAVPARESTEEEIVLMQAQLEQQPPILLLRLRRKLSREAVISALMGQLRLDPGKSDKVGGYYHQLEVGILDPNGVNNSVWDVLADILKANARSLAGIRLEPPALAMSAYMREPKGTQAKPAGAPAAVPSAAEEPDEIDRLFTAGA